MSYRVLVCGGRKYNDREAVHGELDALLREHKWLVVIEGGATGADALAREWAMLHYGGDAGLETHEADWRRHGHAAGPIRNARMLAEGKPDMVLAFPGKRGTADMVQQARDAGVAVKVVGEQQQQEGLFA